MKILILWLQYGPDFMVPVTQDEVNGLALFMRYIYTIRMYMQGKLLRMKVSAKIINVNVLFI